MMPVYADEPQVVGIDLEPSTRSFIAHVQLWAAGPRIPLLPHLYGSNYSRHPCIYLLTVSVA